MTPAGRPSRRLPASIWLLGLTSLFMDLSTEMVHGLLPLFLVGTLGASVTMVGAIDGLAEATAAVAKVFSGALSDALGRRKWLAVAGYALSALSKPLFPLAGGPGPVLAARLGDRLGKGIRVAPRDALVADQVDGDRRGAAFGLRQALDTLGALAGPLAAVGLMVVFAGDFRAVFWVACLPALASVAILLFVPETATPRHGRGFPLRRAELKRLGLPFWLVVAVLLVLLLPRFDESFMLLRAGDLGLAAPQVPLVMAAMNLVAALLSWPAGRWSDRLGRRRPIIAGFALLVLAHLALAGATGPAWVFAGAILWGLHLGITQGVLAALIADLAPADRRGTAYGVFQLAAGVAILVGSVAGGLLWDRVGPAATFAAGAATGVVGLVAFLLILRMLPAAPPSDAAAPPPTR